MFPTKIQTSFFTLLLPVICEFYILIIVVDQSLLMIIQPNPFVPCSCLRVCVCVCVLFFFSVWWQQIFFQDTIMLYFLDLGQTFIPHKDHGQFDPYGLNDIGIVFWMKCEGVCVSVC